jgi:hypothetical protein
MAGGKVCKRQVGLQPNRPRCQLISATACFTSRVLAPIARRVQGERYPVGSVLFIEGKMIADNKERSCPES